jgi:hypothetical protein
MTDAETAGSTATAVDREAIRKEIEDIRTAYHELLTSLSDEDWKKKSANQAWSVGQLMWHLGRGMEFFSQNVGYCRKGKAPNPPAFLIDAGNMLLTRFGSRGATPQSVAEKYDTAHAALLACLDSVQDDEWQKGVKAFGNSFTIESTFRTVKGHFEEHQADILKGLGRL